MLVIDFNSTVLTKVIYRPFFKSNLYLDEKLIERKGQQVLWNVHGVNWIDEGMPGENNLLLFNNGNDEFLPSILQKQGERRINIATFIF